MEHYSPKKKNEINQRQTKSRQNKFTIQMNKYATKKCIFINEMNNILSRINYYNFKLIDLEKKLYALVDDHKTITNTEQKIV